MTEYAINGTTPNAKTNIYSTYLTGHTVNFNTTKDETTTSTNHREYMYNYKGS